MAKKSELTKEEKRLKKLKKSYDNLNEVYSLDQMDVEEQVHYLVDKADELMNEICSMSDSIKIDDLVKVQEITPIDKKTYLDFVYICARKNNDKLKEKAISKFEEDFERRLFITNIRHTFLETFMNGEDLKITDEDNEEFEPFTNYASDDFNDILQDSAKKREYLNTILWVQFNELANAAEYITDLELKRSEFKNLVDWQHYANGGYPNATSPSKIWAIFDRFNKAHRLLTKWGYQKTSKDLEYEFGLDIQEVEEHPIVHPWQEAVSE